MRRGISKLAMRPLHEAMIRAFNLELAHLLDHDA